MAPKPKFALIQALRGIAALWVVLFHCQAAGHGSNWLFSYGNNGVAIFFALSGFVIAHSIRGQQITFEYVGRFALRRSIRLDPAYWASIALFLAFAVVSAMAKHQPFIPPSSGQLAANLTYTQLFLGYHSINDVYWTLCYEVQFYLVLVFCVMAAQRFGTIVYAVPFAAAALFGTGALSSPPGLFLNLWHCFFLGALAYWAMTSKTAMMAFGALAAIVLLSSPTVFAVICLATAAGLLLAGKSGFIERGKSLTFLGTISYSLYLTHNPIAGASFFLLGNHWFALPITVVVCVGAATAFWYAIERPTQRLAQRIGSAGPNASGESRNLVTPSHSLAGSSA